jgi:metal-responsive CopG/Arc/MetJ family transcriptional regulator
MADDNKNTWVHIQIQESELLIQLDEMVKEDDQDRSKFLRKLIRQEWARRVQQHLLMFETPQGKYKAGSK